MMILCFILLENDGRNYNYIKFYKSFKYRVNKEKL